MRILAAAVMGLVGLGMGAGCEEKRADITGVGDYFLGKTKLGQAVGGCEPEGELTRCTHIDRIKLGTQTASAITYYRGSGDDSVLVEIILEIQRCDPKAVLGTLQNKLGKPDEEREARAAWRNPSSYVAAQLPAEPDVCEVNFVDPKEKNRIEYLRTGKTAAERKAESSPSKP